jgi:signal transduction histidine kinase/ligand-binding sensor domain-containing protein
MRADLKELRFAVLLLFALALLGVSAHAERLPVKIFTSADGLGSGFVDYIYRDSKGFMWFCTRDGLSRYDGSRFVTYRVGDTSYPPGIEAIFETKAGVYYVTTTGGTFRLKPDVVSDRRSQERVMTAELLFGARGGMFEDSKGTIWMSYGPLSRLVEIDGKMTLERVDLGLPQNPTRALSVTEIAEGNDGSLWLNSSWGLVRRLPDDRIIFYPFETPTGSGANSMIVAKDGRVWVTRGNRINVLSPASADAIIGSEKITTIPFTSDRQISLEPEKPTPLPTVPGQMFEYSTRQEHAFVENSYTKRLFQTTDGTVWVSAENILIEIAPTTLRIHSNSDGLPAVMGRMAEDSAGNLWIGGHAGLARINRSGLVTFGAGDGVSSSRFFSVTLDQTGAPVFGGRDHTLNRFNGSRLESVRPALPPDSLYLWTSRFAFRSTSNDWWVLSNEKLYRFSGVTEFRQLDRMKPTAEYDASTGLKSNGVFQIFEDSKKRIWVSTRGSTAAGHGVAVLAPGETRFRSLTEADGFPGGKSPASFVEDAAGRIWFGFYEGGLGIYDGNTVRTFNSDQGVPANGHITDIHIDQSGRMWLATSVHGLYRVDNPSSDSPSFSRVDSTSTPLGSNLRTITEDRFRRLYLGSARGVDRYCPDTGHVKRFTVSEGLAADFVVDSVRGTDDDLWFVTNDGISRLTPLQDEDPPPPQIFIGGLQISGAMQSVSELGITSFDSGKLSHTDNNFQIEWFGLDLRAGEFLRYQYMLEGADQEWSPPTDQVTVTYANLRPANYRFLVRAINTEGAVSPSPAFISFSIVPPIWQRWWFLALATLGVGLIVFGFYRYRTARLIEINAALEEAKRAEERLRRSREERLIELERVRTRIATDLHDDIGASLTQIAILSEVARTKNANGNGVQPSPLAKITEVSNELVSTMSDIVWSINPSKDHLSDLVQRMRRFASDVLAPKGIIVRFDLPEDSSAIVVDSNIRREVFLVFKEAVNNAAKHSDATRVDVKLAINARLIELEVHDNGSGFDTAPPSFEDTYSSEGYSGNGIPSMRKRAAEMGGSIDIKSSVDLGTLVRLTMPRELTFDDSIIPNRTSV